MLYREIIAVCSEIHIKHINTLYGQNVELFTVKLAVRMYTVTSKIYWMKTHGIGDTSLRIYNFYLRQLPCPIHASANLRTPLPKLPFEK
jgi:hypothetical protein